MSAIKEKGEKKKRKENDNIGKDIEKLESLFIADRNVK